MKYGKSILIIAIIIAFLGAVFVSDSVSDSDATDHSNSLLLDRGNGGVDWYEIKTAGSVRDVITETLKANGHQCSISGSTLTIDGKTSYVTGTGVETTDDVLNKPGTSSITVKAQWIVYKWDDWAWSVEKDLSSDYSGTYAVGFYPTGTAAKYAVGREYQLEARESVAYQYAQQEIGRASCRERV